MLQVLAGGWQEAAGNVPGFTDVSGGGDFYSHSCDFQALRWAAFPQSRSPEAKGMENILNVSISMYPSIYGDCEHALTK